MLAFQLSLLHSLLVVLVDLLFLLLFFYLLCLFCGHPVQGSAIIEFATPEEAKAVLDKSLTINDQPLKTQHKTR